MTTYLVASNHDHHAVYRREETGQPWQHLDTTDSPEVSRRTLSLLGYAVAGTTDTDHIYNVHTGWPEQVADFTPSTAIDRLLAEADRLDVQIETLRESAAYAGRHDSGTSRLEARAEALRDAVRAIREDLPA